MALSVLAVTAAAAVVVRVTSAATCPMADEVAARLRPLVPASVVVTAAADVRASETLEVSRDQAEIVARLRDGVGGVIGERRLAADHPCDELAAAIAVAAATWQSDVHPEFAVAGPPLPAGAPELRTAAPAPPPLPPTEVDVSVGFGLLQGPREDLPAGLGELSGGLRPQGGPLGVRLRLSGTTHRSLALAGGEVSWRRWTAALGIERRLVDRGRGAFLSVELGALASLFTLRGAGFSTNNEISAFDPGAYTGLRGGWGARRQLWLSAGLSVFTTQRAAYALTSAREARDLPRWELVVVAGAALGSSR